ncbi:MAG: trigger factor [Candidatus Omnitrophica bacterium]|nr:trigger factor [Candidatus Omnitrophota bacterium]
MKIKVKNSQTCQKTLEIEIPKETVKEEFERYYKSISTAAQVPGFRKGKAPRAMLEEYFADKANDKVLTTLLNDTYHKAIEKENIKPVSMPEISEVKFKKDENLTFQAKIDIQPAFTLKEYKNIAIKKLSEEVKEEDVSKVVGYLSERYAQYLPIEDRSVKNDDYIICDYKYSVGDKELDKKEYAWLCVNNDMFIPELAQKIAGATLNEEKTFEIVLPKKFKPEEFAGQKANFKLLVKEIKEKKLPELNDDFAKMLRVESIDKLKEQIKDDLVKEKQLQAKQDLKAQIINYLEKIMPIDVPQTLVEKRETLLRDGAVQRMKQQGLNDQQIETELKKMDDMFSKEALKQVRVFFILENIALAEKIKVEQAEFDVRISEIAASYNQKKEEVLKYLSEKNLLENIHWDVWEEKIIAFLLANAKISESSK